MILDPDDGYNANTVVEHAVAALTAFGHNLDRAAATRLLALWAHNGELSGRERAAILRRFPEQPPAPESDDAQGASGPGWPIGPARELHGGDVDWWTDNER